MKNENENVSLPEKKEVGSDAELIARFMGGKFYPNGIHSEWRFPDGSRPKELLYHTSWDWLMPVVEKIHKIKGIHYIIEGSCCMVIYNYGNLIVKESTDSMIETVYRAVGEFIKWYNLNTKPL